MRGRGVRIVAVLLVLAGMTVPVASASSSASWVHWEGAYFACWIPNKEWQVVESSTGLAISSPTGTATVNYADASSPEPYSLSALPGALLTSPLTGLRSVRLLSHGRTFATGGGGIGQVTDFQAFRLRDRTTVRGVLTVEVFNDYATGSYGFAAYLQGAPANQWKQWAPTLAIIQNRIVVYAHTSQAAPAH